LYLAATVIIITTITTIIITASIAIEAAIEAMTKKQDLAVLFLCAVRNCNPDEARKIRR
jgi:hypothetical protein